MDDQLVKAALEYHRYPRPGKITVMPTKAMTNQLDLALAYSPNVVVPSMEIQRQPTPSSSRRSSLCSMSAGAARIFGAEGLSSLPKLERDSRARCGVTPKRRTSAAMHADAAPSKPLLSRVLPGARLSSAVDLLVMPTLDAAKITFNVLKTLAGESISVGPMLLDAALPAHILTSASAVRRIVNMTAICAFDAQEAMPAPDRAANDLALGVQAAE